MMTIGHSTLELDAFVRALRDNGCTTLVDVRSIPRSRHNPQFNHEALFPALAQAGIAGRWMKVLGGLRHARKDSINMAWRNDSFRGYADYMQTPEFAAGIAELMALPHFDAVTVMCSEAVPWRCHRSLIADAVLARIADAVLAREGVVEDIFVLPDGESHRKPHTMTKFACVEGTRVWYPAVAVDEGATLFGPG